MSPLPTSATRRGIIIPSDEALSLLGFHGSQVVELKCHPGLNRTPGLLKSSLCRPVGKQLSFRWYFNISTTLANFTDEIEIA